MHMLIAEHRAAIADLCRRYAVRRLDVFGSAARGIARAAAEFDAQSDTKSP